MSGGKWNYRQFEIEEVAYGQVSQEYREILLAVAQTEHIIDWAECSDTSRVSAEHALYELWISTFDKVFGDG